MNAGALEMYDNEAAHVYFPRSSSSALGPRLNIFALEFENVNTRNIERLA